MLISGDCNGPATKATASLILTKNDVVTLAFEATFWCQDSGLKWTARKSDFEAIHGIYWECKMIPDKLAITYTVILENANNAGFLSNLCLELTKIYRT